MRILVWSTIGAIAVFLILLIVNTVRYPSRQVQVPEIDPVRVDADPPVNRLSQAIQIPTLSHEDPNKIDPAPFIAFHRFLETAYPECHKTLERITINDFSLLYKWQGSDPELAPVVLMAHQDVVPVEKSTRNQWTHGAFSGKIVDGFVWGRGALDDKGCLVAMMESVEMLVNRKFQPRRPVYFAFGHDEEIGGRQGAAKIAAHMEDKGVRAAFVIDEGMTIIKKDLSPANRKTALIGLSEKGYVTLKVSASADGGHSSMPPAKTAIGSLARAISSLEIHQMPIHYDGPAAGLFDVIGPEMPFPKKILFANLWAFKPLVTNQLEKGTTTNALIRTTCAPTLVQGGIKENILPGQAYALVNFRILQGDSISDVVDHARKVIDDPDIDVSIHDGPFHSEPSSTADIDSFGFKMIRQTIHEVFNDTIVAPGLVFGATDSRHFASVSDNIYRFVPYHVGKKDTERIHGVDERIAIDDFVKLIQFYAQLIENCSGYE